MLIIKFCREAQPVSDYDIQSFVDSVIPFTVENRIETFKINNFLILEEICARIKEKRINHDFVTVRIQSDDNIEDFYDFIIDKDGRSDDWRVSKVLFSFMNISLRQL